MPHCCDEFPSPYPSREEGGAIAKGENCGVSIACQTLRESVTQNFMTVVQFAAEKAMYATVQGATRPCRVLCDCLAGTYPPAMVRGSLSTSTIMRAQASTHYQ